MTSIGVLKSNMVFNTLIAAIRSVGFKASESAMPFNASIDWRRDQHAASASAFRNSAILMRILGSAISFDALTAIVPAVEFGFVLYAVRYASDWLLPSSIALQNASRLALIMHAFTTLL